MQEFTYDQFVIYLRSALHYLYDPVHLRSSPLVALLRLTAEFDQAAALQHTLTEAIRNLKPTNDEPPQSRAWRIYDTLNFLHLRQLERDAVALQLGISERQLRREQRLALEVMAQQLWSQVDHTAPAAVAMAKSSDQPALDTNQSLSEELVWLKNPAAEPRIALGEALQTVQSLAQPLAQQWQAQLQVAAPPELAEVAIAPLALRSILLTILSVAIPRAGRTPVAITAGRRGDEIEFTVRCDDQTVAHVPFSEKDVSTLQTAQNLAAFYKTQLSFSTLEGAGFAATFALPVPEQIPVLVIDDNADWVELLQRYTAGSHYQLTGTREPGQAHKLAEKLQPAVICLDVMMHDVDGWQVLSELRHLPTTAHIPIVICTILPVEDLAISLGANAFLQKPVTQQQFLKTLNELA